MFSAAAHPKVTQLFASVVHEVSTQTLDTFKEFLAERIEFDAELESHFVEFKKQLEVSTKMHVKNANKNIKSAATKKPRALSKYNEYIREKISDLKSGGHTGNLMKMAVEAYNKEKQENV